MPALSFFIGKGGVGKTTVSSAYAVHRARTTKRKVLLISTDPAHSLADVFNARFGDAPKKIAIARHSLTVWQINAEKQFRKFLGRQRDNIFAVLESGTLFTRKEIEPLLSTSIPGMAEVAALLAIYDVLQAAKYDEIVVDTAPMGHTLRLFEMPGHFARFLDFLALAASRDQLLAERFGGGRVERNPFIADWRQVVDAVQTALRAQDSRLVLVTSPESFSLNESLRAAQQLAESEFEISQIVLNRIVTSSERCVRCKHRHKMATQAKKFLQANFPDAPVAVGEDSGAPLIGVEGLAGFGATVFSGKKQARKTALPPKALAAKITAAKWPELRTPLALTLGKGGVGKTTISAALAYVQRRRYPKRAITICSTDPAPSLDDVLAQRVGNQAVSVLRDPKLRAAEIDSVAEFRQWAEAMKEKIDKAMSSESRGVHVDLSFDRALFSALLDIVPPGVDELFAIFRILDEIAAKQTVIIDMAPTGHALELLRMPERLLLWSRLVLRALAEHRQLPLAQDVAVEVARLGQRVRGLAAMLKDRRRAQLWPVMLAEPLPDRETRRLLQALTELRAYAPALFINRLLLRTEAKNCARCQAAQAWQISVLAGLGRKLRRKLYLVREFPSEIAGAQALQSFTKELWQLS